jgi:hypothetical protein
MPEDFAVERHHVCRSALIFGPCRNIQPSSGTPMQTNCTHAFTPYLSRHENRRLRWVHEHSR